MTWTWDTDGLGTTQQAIHVYDASGTEVHAETRDGWQGDDPEQAVLNAMYAEANAAIQNQNVERAISIVLDGAFGQIEPKSDQ